MRSADLVSRLYAAGDPAPNRADTLVAAFAEVERLRIRVQLLEGVARLNGETIRSMQRRRR